MKKETPKYCNPIQTKPQIEEIPLLTLYQKEWEITIQTQMHFNELIIKFRSIILSVFITLIGVIFAIAKQFNFCFTQFLALLSIPIIIWFAAFILDFGYYHKMLMGAVNQAKKFDDDDLFKKYGLFGLTENISKHIEPPKAGKFIFAYYTLPLILLLVLLLIFFKQFFN